MTTVNYRFVVKRDTAASFTAANTLLLQGEWALETDTGKFKMGDGVTAWNSLAYVTTSRIPEGTNLYFTDERAQDAVATMIAAGTHSGITFTYDDANNKISATVTAGVSDGDKGDVVVTGSGSTWTLESNFKKGAIRAVFDGMKDSSGTRQVLQVGTTVYGLSVPYSGTITAARILADQVGSLVVSVWKDTYANYPPTSGDNIAASAPPTLSSALTSYDTTLTGWNKTVAAGDVFRIAITSASTVTWAEITLEITKS
jgi:hypothetical protein